MKKKGDLRVMFTAVMAPAANLFFASEEDPQEIKTFPGQ
jgi:hypothetical protein